MEKMTFWLHVIVTSLASAFCSQGAAPKFGREMGVALQVQAANATLLQFCR